MDGCVAVVVAKAEAVVVAVGEAEAVAVAVAAGDISPDETHLRRLNMRNKFFKKAPEIVRIPMFSTLFDENLIKR